MQSRGVAIFLYDFTGLMAKPWLEAGYECWCFDGQHPQGITRDGLHVKVGMWFYPDRIDEHASIIAQMIGRKVCMVFGFPECTHLTVAGARHFEKKRAANPMFQHEAMSLALLVPRVAELCDTDCWAFENPRGVLSTMYRKPDFTFHPNHYGGYLPEGDEHPIYPDIYPGRDAYNKGTDIWCGPGFCEPERIHVPVLYKDNPGWKKCGGKSTRTKNIRSATPRGFSLATHQHNAPHLKKTAEVKAA
jgi:hypothetical protein